MKRLRTDRTIHFTDRTIPTLNVGKRTTFFDDDPRLPGFGLRVSPSRGSAQNSGGRARRSGSRSAGRQGVRTFVLFYRTGRRLRCLTLGRFSVLTLADARDRARAALAEVTGGGDPAGKRRAEREAVTFDAMAADYVQRYAKIKKRTWKKDAGILNYNVLPYWRGRKAKDIEPRDVRELVDAIRDRGAPVQANRTFALIRKLYNWASAPDRAYVPHGFNPCRGLERPAAERQRERVLTADELRALLHALDEEAPAIRALFRLQLLTGQRGGEVRAMRWADVDRDDGWWTVPAEHAKNKLAHRVPLSPAALAILRDLPVDAAWLFPSTTADAPRWFPSKEWRRVLVRAGLNGVQPHDLRRTVATFLTSELNVSRLVVSKILNHVETGVTKVYDRASYDREKRQALDAWARRLHQIVTGEATQKVVELRRS